MQIPIFQIKKIREELNLDQLVIFGVAPNGAFYVSTHGKNKLHSEEAANYGNKLKETLGFPEEMCVSKPLERVCKNCDYFSGTMCYAENISVITAPMRPSCRHFLPNK